MSRGDAPPLPPFEFQTLVCGPGSEALFEPVGQGVADAARGQGLLSPGADFLDVGCGCGRVARYLLDSPIGSYRGFDRHPGMIAWCNQALAPVDPRFRFQHVDVSSVYAEWDGHASQVGADRLVFPFPDASFDSVLLSSVFTHMDAPEIQRYLVELVRVLRPEGRILASVLFSEGAAYRSDQVNFFFAPNTFQALVTKAGLAAKALSDKPTYGYEQNWFLLTLMPR